MKTKWTNPECSPIVGGSPLPRGSRELLPITNPADETVVGTLVCATLDDIRNALEAAEAARHSWRQCPASERGAILTRAADLMRGRIKENAELLTLEQGKTLAESEVEWERAVETFEWHGREAERLNATTILKTSRGERIVAPEPMGVAAAFTPWNYPAVIIARKRCVPRSGLPRYSQGGGRDAQHGPRRGLRIIRCGPAPRGPAGPVRQTGRDLRSTSHFTGRTRHVLYGLDSGWKASRAYGR